MRLKHFVDQLRAVAQCQVLRHLLSVGNVMHGQLVANRHVQQYTGMRGLVHLGENATHQVCGACRLITVTVGPHHLVECVPMAGSVEQQQPFDGPAGAAQHGDLVRNCAVSLAHADRVDQHHVLVAKICQHTSKVSSILDSVYGNTQDLAVDTQLLIGTDPVTVRGDKRQLVGTETHDAARSQLGSGGGFPDAGRPHQRIDTPFVHERILVFQHRQPTLNC